MEALNVLAAADRLLRVDPTASLEDIAHEAGASRATVHRRFPTRGDLLVALSRWAVGRIVAALESAQIGTAPPYVALYQAVRNVIDVKVGLEYARTLPPADDPVVSGLQHRMRERAATLLADCQTDGLIASDTDQDWALTAFYALVHEASAGSTNEADDPEYADRAASQVIETLLHGLSPHTTKPAPDRLRTA